MQIRKYLPLGMVTIRPLGIWQSIEHLNKTLPGVIEALALPDKVKQINCVNAILINDRKSPICC